MIIDIRTIAEQLVVVESDRAGCGGRMIEQLQKSIRFLRKIEQHTQTFVHKLDIMMMHTGGYKPQEHHNTTMLEVKRIFNHLIQAGTTYDFAFNQALMDFANSCSRTEQRFAPWSDQLRMQIICTKEDYLSRFEEK
jgi:hypothetical protein